MSDKKTFAAADLFAVAGRPAPLTPVEVPSLGTAYIRVMDGPTWSRFQKLWSENTDDEGKLEDADTVKAWLLVLTVTDADGKPLFADADVIKLAAVEDHRLTHPLIERAWEVNGIGGKAVKDAAKNSEAGPASS